MLPHESPHSLVLSIPVHVAVAKRLVGELASNADQLALQCIRLSLLRNERTPKPRVLLLPVVRLRFLFLKYVEHGECCSGLTTGPSLCFEEATFLRLFLAPLSCVVTAASKLRNKKRHAKICHRAQSLRRECGPAS